MWRKSRGNGYSVVLFLPVMTFYGYNTNTYFRIVYIVYSCKEFERLIFVGV